MVHEMVEACYRRVRDGSNYLKTFILCATMYGSDDASVRALLVRIEDAVHKFQHTFLSMFGGGTVTTEVLVLAFDYEDDLKSLKQEINEWYIIFSDYSSKPSSCSPERDELVEFIDSILKNIKDFADWRSRQEDAVVDLQDALKEKLMFGKNFIRFITLLGIDEKHLRQLLTRIKAVAINAAHCCYMSHFVIYHTHESTSTGEEDEVKFNISGLLQLYDTCVQVLTDSKLSRQSVSTETVEIDRQILEDFLDSLLSSLWEILKSGNLPIFSTKCQLQVFYEGLRSLRTILKKQSENFDGNMWDLIGVVVSDAGLVICSLFRDAIEEGLAKEMDLMLFDLLERIKPIRANVAGKSPEGSKFDFPEVDELGFIDYLLENLKELTSFKVGSISLEKHQIQKIQEEFVLLRSFLGRIVELRHQQEELQGLWSRIVGLAYMVEFLIDSFAIGDDPEFSLMSLDSITEELKTIKLDALKIFDREGLDVNEEKVTKWSNHLPLGRSMPIIKDEIVGLNDDVESIKVRLTRGADKLQIIAIVGMPGLGKTTLAKKVYNDSSILDHFSSTRAWCCISQVYDQKNLLTEILTCFDSDPCNNYSKMTEEELAQALRRKLLKTRYLIVLDDVWDTDAWNSLKLSFPDDGKGSRILLTSRYDVAEFDKETHFQRALNDEDSLKLLRTKLFPREGQWPPTLSELGMQIVEKCKGLPLTIVILAGILATKEQDDWKEVVGCLSLSTVSSTEQCKNTLELSYGHLPDKLKPCFLYFGAFPEDQEIATKKLVCLWIAEGFVRKTQSVSLEDEAKGYLMNLIGRSLVTVSKQSSTGEVKTCRIHDLLHEFCIEKAKEERFFQLLQGYEELSNFNEPHDLRRLCIHSKPEYFKQSRQFCPRVRCLLFFNRGDRYQYYFNLSLVVRIFKLVRVLDLSQIFLGSSFSSEIELLVQLRYLAVMGKFNSIPAFIASLSNLETFIVDTKGFVGEVELPASIWKSKKLRHLKKKDNFRAGFSLPNEDLDNTTELCNLDTFSTAIMSWENLENKLKRLPNIRRLKVRLLDDGASTGEGNKALVLEMVYLSILESLTVSPYMSYDMQYQIDFRFPLNLKKLTLSEFNLSWCNISAIGSLPNLEVLKLLNGAFRGEIWNMEEAEQFPNVKFLKLANLDIVRWTASESEDHLPRLEKLVLDGCYRLVEVPSCLGNLYNLQMIKVTHCSAAASSLEQIVDEQVGMGNTELKVDISPNKDDDYDDGYDDDYDSSSEY